MKRAIREIQNSCAYVYRKNRVNIARKSRSELNILTILHANFPLAERRKSRHVRNANKLTILNSIEQNPSKETIYALLFHPKRGLIPHLLGTPTFLKNIYKKTSGKEKSASLAMF